METYPEEKGYRIGIPKLYRLFTTVSFLPIN